MKISIAMATYNGAKYLRAQLESFASQTRQPDELIISDDCSTDETESIVQEFVESAPFRVEFYRNKKNLGYCGNFNSALLKTTGDLVFLSDQDDVWYPSKIEYMAGVAVRNPTALVVMNDAALTDSELNPVGLTKIGQIRAAGFPMDAFVMGCCCALRRQLLDFCMPIPVEFRGHDNWLVEFADGLGAKLVDESILQFYRRHESNESQFIANRATKVTRAQARIHSFKKSLQQKRASDLRFKLIQLRMFADGVQKAITNAPDKYQTQLLELDTLYRESADTIEKRVLAVDQSLIPRIVSVGVLMIRGGYSNTNTLRSVVRDIIG